MVDKVGSINRITNDKLNQTCAAIRAIKCPGFAHPVYSAKSPTWPVSSRKSMPMVSSSPPGSINIKKPIATTIEGVTNGTDNNALIVLMFFHLYRPRYQATGSPINRVIMVEIIASSIVNFNALIVSSSSKKFNIASITVRSVTEVNL